MLGGSVRQLRTWTESEERPLMSQQDIPRSATPSSMSSRRPRFARPSLQEFEDRIHELTPDEAKSPTVEWLVAECRRAREEAHSLRNQMRAFKGGKSL